MQHSVKGYFFGMFLLLMVALLTQESVEAIESYKDVYPERIHTTRHKRDLSTSVKGYHEDKVTYKIGDIVLDLKRSEKIHPGHILVRSYDEDTEQLTHEKVTPEQCHYHGKIRGNKDSDVHISTCDGLHGIIHGGRVKREIEKVNDDGLHRLTSLYDEMITDAADILKELDNDEIYLGAGIDNESNTQRDTKQIRQSHFHNNKKYHPRFSLFNVEEQYKKYLGENSKTRYIEMFVCTDVGLYEKYDKDKNKVIERVLNAYSQVDKAYQAINIRIVIVAVEVLVKKAFERFEKAGSDLYSFQIYWNEVIKKDSNFKDIRMDNGQFLSHYHWAYAGGMAYDGGMCTDDSVAVNRWYYYLVNGPKVILGHELGHNLNFDDDGPECTCLTSKGCFMGGTKSSMPGFSDCSLKRMQLKDFTCLNDYPEKSLKPVCGNGIKEANEECDCGTEETCKNNNDHCCQPFGCKLKQGVQCSHLNFPGCCNEKCLDEDTYDVAQDRKWEKEDKQKFSSNFDQPEGSVKVYFSDCDNPVDYFLRFCDDDIFDSIIYQSNLYIHQSQKKVPILKKNELYGFMGIGMAMGYHNLPSWKHYWNNDPDLSVTFISNVLPRNRFLQTLSNIHVNVNKSMPVDKADNSTNFAH